MKSGKQISSAHLATLDASLTRCRHRASQPTLSDREFNFARMR